MAKKYKFSFSTPVKEIPEDRAEHHPVRRRRNLRRQHDLGRRRVELQPGRRGHRQYAQTLVYDSSSEKIRQWAEDFMTIADLPRLCRNPPEKRKPVVQNCRTQHRRIGRTRPDGPVRYPATCGRTAQRTPARHRQRRPERNPLPPAIPLAGRPRLPGRSTARPAPFPAAKASASAWPPRSALNSPASPISWMNRASACTSATTTA
jgi:hypothetical protein